MGKNKIYKSKCCGVGVSVGGVGETHHYICNKCDKACDFIPVEPKPPKRSSRTSTWENELFMRLTYLDLPKKYHKGLTEFVREQKEKSVRETILLAQKEANRYFLDPLFPQLKVAVTEILIRVQSSLNPERE